MTPVSPSKALDLIEERLKEGLRASRKQAPSYFVPSLWRDPKAKPERLRVNPHSFYLDAIRRIKKAKRPARKRSTGGEWSSSAVIYNMFVRTTTAFDHNGNGTLDLPVNEQGFRETGTFLKAIALLPYLKHLGASAVHLLPITAIGHDGNKGTLGSPYAIRNPYELDENLAEPCLGLDAKTEFRAFVEAAHRLGLRVVVEFVFRTAAKDADWVAAHPEWFYWIRESVPVRAPHETDGSKYGSPVFTREELEHIHHEVREHRFSNLLPPHESYRAFFTQPPAQEVVVKENGRYVGRSPEGVHVKIPGAFADWPPDDTQPPWNDVTYLRMYTHPDFNYIAYNTIRMYDDRLAQPEHVNRPLWDRIVGIIPYYQQEFGIDGVMIDMGHALPMQLKSEMVQAARKFNPDFAFWDENFSITRRSREEGYNAVVGFLWIDQHHPARLKAFCRRAGYEGFPVPFFATPENHNTPRACARPGGIRYAQWSWVINCFLPGIPFLHSGFELAERYPINTGLDFSAADLAHLPSEKLPLFSAYGFDWLREEQFTDWIARVAAIRRKYERIIVNPDPTAFELLNVSNDHILGFARISLLPEKRIAIIGNSNFHGNEEGEVKLETDKSRVVDLLSGKKINVIHHHLRFVLHPGQCLVFEY